jgi:hypothetical protein
MKELIRDLDLLNERLNLQKLQHSSVTDETFRRLAYVTSIKKLAPTSEELLVVTSEVSRRISDPSPPSLISLRRWLHLWRASGSQARRLKPRNADDELATSLLYEE